MWLQCVMARKLLPDSFLAFPPKWAPRQHGCCLCGQVGSKHCTIMFSLDCCPTVLYFPFFVRILHLFSKTCSSAFKNEKLVFLYSAVKQNKINILKKNMLMTGHQPNCLGHKRNDYSSAYFLSLTKTRWQPSGFKRTHTSLTDAMIHTAEEKKKVMDFFFWKMSEHKRAHESQSVFFFPACILKAYQEWYMGWQHCETGRCLWEYCSTNESSFQIQTSNNFCASLLPVRCNKSQIVKMEQTSESVSRWELSVRVWHIRVVFNTMKCHKSNLNLICAC